MNISFNGKIIEDKAASISPSDRGFLLGDGLFETIRCEKGFFIHFKEHYQRLLTSAIALKLKLNYSCEDLLTLCHDLIISNHFQHGISSLRITLSRGISGRGIYIDFEAVPTLLITSAPYQSPINYPKTYLTSVVRSKHSKIVRMKTLNYLEPILSRMEAQENHCDEGIMLNSDGAITETSIGNLFFVLDNGSVITPPVEDGLLPGIMRNKIIETALENGIPISESTVFPKDLKKYKVVECFHTNSLFEVQNLASMTNQSGDIDLTFLSGPEAITTSRIFNLYKKSSTIDWDEYSTSKLNPTAHRK